MRNGFNLTRKFKGQRVQRVQEPIFLNLATLVMDRFNGRVSPAWDLAKSITVRLQALTGTQSLESSRVEVAIPVLVRAIKVNMVEHSAICRLHHLFPHSISAKCTRGLEVWAPLVDTGRLGRILDRLARPLVKPTCSRHLSSTQQHS